MMQSATRKLFILSSLLQALFWSNFGTLYSFSTVFLLSKNFENKEIGLILACANILAVILQPTIGAWADRSQKISLRAIILAMSCTVVVFLLIVGIGHFSAIVLAFLYGIAIALALTMQPLINAFIFTYINAGYDVNFGFSRGIGSLSFAALSFTVGMLINQYSPEFIPWVGILLTTLLVLVTLMFPKINIQADRLIVENQSELSAPLLKNGFLGKYGLFPVFLFSLIFLFTFHTIINTYLNQITTSLGAANGDFGTSLTIAALSELPAMLGFGYLLKKMKVTVLLKISGFFYALRGLLYLFATSVAMINATQLLQALSFAVLTPAAVYYVNHIMTENDRVKGQTFMVGATTVGSVAGSLLGGWLLDISSVRVMLLAGFLAALLGGVLMFVATREELADIYSGLRKAKHNE